MRLGGSPFSAPASHPCTSPPPTVLTVISASALPSSVMTQSPSGRGAATAETASADKARVKSAIAVALAINPSVIDLELDYAVTGARCNERLGLQALSRLRAGLGAGAGAGGRLIQRCDGRSTRRFSRVASPR